MGGANNATAYRMRSHDRATVHDIIYDIAAGMKYLTTRGGIRGASFQEALLSGYAPDGGMFLPESLPKFTRAEIQSWVALSYPQLIEKFLRLFVLPDELSSQEISSE